MSQTAQRERRAIRPEKVWLLKLCGFRYSYRRDAYVLRGIGRRLGPVFVADRRSVRPGDH